MDQTGKSLLSKRKLKGVKMTTKEKAAYDSTADTLKHIRVVQSNLNLVINKLIERGEKHDESKLHSPEKEAFDRETPKLKTLTYGSDEYKASLNNLGEALAHHYEKNSHHPEHYKEHGVGDMNLLDIVEMACDWKAAAERTKNGIVDLEYNFRRFNFDPQLSNIFRQTWKALGWVSQRDIDENHGLNKTSS